MTTGTRSAVGVSAAAILIGFLFGSAAFAQDSMQLDTMFRDSLSQGRDFQAKREDENVVSRNVATKHATPISCGIRKDEVAKGTTRKGDSAYSRGPVRARAAGGLSVILQES